MTMTPPRRRLLPFAALSFAALLLAACGGGDPLSNPSTIVNGASDTSNQRLSLAYFQRCVEPILNAQLPIQLNGTTTTNTCANAGCHAPTGTGGSFRVVPNAANVDLTGTADTIRPSDMYKNFYSAQGEVVVGTPTQSRLLQKPELLNVNHGGGLIFASASDPNVQTIAYWINHPEPAGQDEFSTSTYSAYFTGADPVNGSCITQ